VPYRGFEQIEEVAFHFADLAARGAVFFDQ
jgi:hypothetical protein